jgi:hypothetical protein
MDYCSLGRLGMEITDTELVIQRMSSYDDFSQKSTPEALKQSFLNFLSPSAMLFS